MSSGDDTRRIGERFVLGTVQLGVPYGRRRHTTVVALEEAFAILDAAWSIGIRAFDTAEAYGLSAPRLRRWLGERGYERSAAVVTKIQVENPAQVAGLAREALRRFSGIENLTLLSHGEIPALAWETLLAAAEAQGACAGQSVYEPAAVRRVVALRGIGRIQAPANVFDLRAVEARGAAPPRLDLRSIYVQGLLVAAPEEAERMARGGRELARLVASAAAEVDVDASALLVRAVMDHIGPGDRLVIGADEPDQLTALERALRVTPAQIGGFLERLLSPSVPSPGAPVLDPRTW